MRSGVEASASVRGLSLDGSDPSLSLGFRVRPMINKSSPCKGLDTILVCIPIKVSRLRARGLLIRGLHYCSRDYIGIMAELILFQFMG